MPIKDKDQEKSNEDQKSQNDFKGLSNIDTDKGLAETLNLLEDIRKMTEGEKLQLPQICVIGDQSSGKSSLLSSISGLKFPEASKTCTKCPIIVNMRRGNECFLKIGNDEVYKGSEMNQLIKQFQDKIMEINKAKKGITKDPINVEVRTPFKAPLTLVDLPGIVHLNNEDEKKTLEIIEEYISPENSTILVTREAGKDIETEKALFLAKKFDKMGKRTIEILTKADIVVNIDLSSFLNAEK